MGIELRTKQGHITLTAPKTVEGGSVDLSNYYTKAQTDEKIQEVVNAIPEVDLSDYATKEEIPDVSRFVTATYVQTAINENAPDLSGYALKTDIPDVSDFIIADDISGFQTEEQVIALIEEYGSKPLPISEEGEF